MTHGKIKTMEFIDHLELLSQNASEDTFHIDSRGEKCNEKQYLKHLVKKARELIDYNEWFVALENTIDNLSEINYKLESRVLNLASEALTAGSNKSDRLKVINFFCENLRYLRAKI